MSTKNTDIIMQNKVFAWIALAAAVLLSVPLVAMQFTDEVNWSISDFVIMGMLLISAGSGFVYVARVVPRKYRVATGLIFLMVFLYIWAELAVGVFTGIGS